MKSRWVIATVIAGALLSGCGKSGVEIGDVFVAKESFLCADTIESYRGMSKDGVVETDGETVTSIFEEEEFTVIEVNEKEEMVKFVVTEGHDEGAIWWTHKDALTNEAERIDTEGGN